MMAGIRTLGGTECGSAEPRSTSGVLLSRLKFHTALSNTTSSSQCGELILTDGFHLSMKTSIGAVMRRTKASGFQSLERLSLKNSSQRLRDPILKSTQWVLRKPHIFREQRTCLNHTWVWICSLIRHHNSPFNSRETPTSPRSRQTHLSSISLATRPTIMNEGPFLPRETRCSLHQDVSGIQACTVRSSSSIRAASERNYPMLVKFRCCSAQKHSAVPTSWNMEDF